MCLSLKVIMKWFTYGKNKSNRSGPRKRKQVVAIVPVSERTYSKGADEKFADSVA
jgi:hypothetical protein